MSARGLGKEPQQAQKPPAFRKGKQVVLSIWVPGGIACKVTINATKPSRQALLCGGFVKL